MKEIKKDKDKHGTIITVIKSALDYGLADVKDMAVCYVALAECEICTGRVAVTSNALFGMNEIVSLGSGEGTLQKYD